MEPEAAPKKTRRFDFKFWTIAGMVGAVLAFNIAESLVLDADPDDIGYARQIIPAHRVSDPSPGDVYIFNHENNDFVETKVCSLQKTSSDFVAEENKISASNILGTHLNEAMASVAGWVGEKVTNLAMVESPKREWVYFKTHRPTVQARMDPDCLQTVVAIATSKSLTPFIVDSVYEVQEADAKSTWLKFADPLIMEAGSCEHECPAPKTLRDIIKVDAFTRMKVDWNIVKIN